MAEDLAAALARPVTFQATQEVTFPMTAVVGGVQWQVRLNDFPDEPLFALYVDGRKLGDFEDWPDAWQRPT